MVLCLFSAQLFSRFLSAFLEFCFAVSAHTHSTVVLTVLVFGALCELDAAAVAEKDGKFALNFYKCVLVVHKVVLDKTHFFKSFSSLLKAVERRV
ncbi:hypothetical protein [Marinobacter shengliensis]|uniref:hypothetical protein n=1 Tax=Marinobacter shengliensis TaxID=1389223 RepID=UPI0035B897D3